LIHVFEKIRCLFIGVLNFAGLWGGDGGGPSASLTELLCRPDESRDLLEYPHTPPYRDVNVLHQKYVVDGLSIRQIAKEFLSSKEAVRIGLIKAGIPLVGTRQFQRLGFVE